MDDRKSSSVTIYTPDLRVHIRLGHGCPDPISSHNHNPTSIGTHYCLNKHSNFIATSIFPNLNLMEPLMTLLHLGPTTIIPPCTMTLLRKVSSPSWYLPLYTHEPPPLGPCHYPASTHPPTLPKFRVQKCSCTEFVSLNPTRNYCLYCSIPSL
jgi:hypothetical protein